MAFFKKKYPDIEEFQNFENYRKFRNKNAIKHDLWGTQSSKKLGGGGPPK